MVTVAIPIWIAERNRVSFTTPSDLPSVALVLLGIAALVAGLGLFVACVLLFWSQGRGTLAPWDPPRHLVTDGPYRFVRNPMISGVIFVLIGEACLLRSMPLAEWAGLVTDQRHLHSAPRGTHAVDPVWRALPDVYARGPAISPPPASVDATAMTRDRSVTPICSSGPMSNGRSGSSITV